MTSHKEHIQTLIAEIDSVLQRTNPRLPWVMSGEVAQQRQILERVRNYLVSLQQTMPALDGTEPRSLGDSADLTPYQMMQMILRDVGYLRTNLGTAALQPPAPTPALNQPQLTAEVVQILLSRLQENLSQQIAQALESVRGTGAYGSAPLLGSGGAIAPVYDASPALRSRSDQMLVNLDASLTVVFESLQRNVQAYQDSLSQGLERLYATGQQSEHALKQLLEDLVQQVKQETLAQLRSPQAQVGIGNPPPPESPPAAVDLNPPPELLDLSDLSLTPVVTTEPRAAGYPVSPNFPYAGTEVLATEISGMDLTLPSDEPLNPFATEWTEAGAADSGSLDGAIESWLQAVSAMNQPQAATPPPAALPEILPLDLSDFQLGDVDERGLPTAAIAPTDSSTRLDNLGDVLILDLLPNQAETAPTEMPPVERTGSAIAPPDDDDTTNIDAALKLLEDLSVELESVSADLSMAEAEAQLEQMLGGTVAQEDHPGLPDDAQDELDEFYQSLFGSELAAAAEAAAPDTAAPDIVAPENSIPPEDINAPEINVPEILDFPESIETAATLSDLDLSAVTPREAPIPSFAESAVSIGTESDLLEDAAIVEDLLAAFTEPTASAGAFGLEEVAIAAEPDVTTLGFSDFAAEFSVDAPPLVPPDRPLADPTASDGGDWERLELSELSPAVPPSGVDLADSLGAIAALDTPPTPTQGQTEGMGDALDLFPADLFPATELSTGFESAEFPPSQPQTGAEVPEVAIDLTDLMATDRFSAIAQGGTTPMDLPATAGSMLDLGLDLGIELPTTAPASDSAVTPQGTPTAAELSFADLANSLTGDAIPSVTPVNPPTSPALAPGDAGSLADLFQEVPDPATRSTPVEPPGLWERPPSPPVSPTRSTDMLLVDHSFGSSQPDSEDQFTRAIDEEVLLVEEVKVEGAIAFELDDFTLSSLSEDLATLETDARSGQSSFTLEDLASGIPTRSTVDNTAIAPAPRLERPNLESPPREDWGIPEATVPPAPPSPPPIAPPIAPPVEPPSVTTAPVFYQASPAIADRSLDGFTDLFGDATPPPPPLETEQPFTLADTQNLFEDSSGVAEPPPLATPAASAAEYPQGSLPASLEVNLGAMNPIVVEDESSPFTLEGMDDLFGSAPVPPPISPTPLPVPPPTSNPALGAWESSAGVYSTPVDPTANIISNQDIPLTLEGMDDLFGTTAPANASLPREIPPFKPELFKPDEFRLDESAEPTPPFQLEKLDNLFVDAPAIAEPSSPPLTDKQSLDAALQRILGNSSPTVNGETQNNSQKKKTP